MCTTREHCSSAEEDTDNLPKRATFLAASPAEGIASVHHLTVVYKVGCWSSHFTHWYCSRTEGGLVRASDGLENLLVSRLLPYTPSNQICCDLLLGRVKEKQKTPPLKERKSLSYSRLTVLNLCVGHSSFGVRILVMLHIKCLQFIRVAELQLQSSNKLIL